MSTAPYRCYPYLALAVFAMLAADLGVIGAASLHPGPAGAAVWLTLTTVFGWWWLVCVASSLEVAEGRLVYQAPVASGSVGMARVRSVRPAPGLPGAALVRIAGRVPLLVPLRPGWAPLAAQLARHPCRPADPAGTEPPHRVPGHALAPAPRGGRPAGGGRV
jgi:hypothetical protein